MRCHYRCSCFTVLLVAAATSCVLAQNPIIRNQFTADPAARVFGDSVYLYPSHDILATEGRGRPGWFCMEDYHVFSSANLVDWKDDGVILSQTTVPWADPRAYALWAPDCVSRNGKFFFYFPAPAKDTTHGRGFSIGVAVAEKPWGPFTPQPAPIDGVRGIDPNPFIDDDGQAYLYWAGWGFQVAKLKANMVELDGRPQPIAGLPTAGLKEGPYVFKRNGKYYLTYPHVQNKTERLEYAIGESPTGPFTVAGVIMDESSECWTNQQSIIEFKNQWYLFYHHNDLSPNFDKNRSVRIDSLFFNDDGTIRKVIPTLRGVGATEASREIQIDRYSARSERGVSTEFLDTLNTFGGWKTVLDTAGAWIQYNSVDFGGRPLASVSIRVRSATGGALQVRVDRSDGPLLAAVAVPGGHEWTVVKAGLSNLQPGIHNLRVLLEQDAEVEIDWVSFE